MQEVTIARNAAEMDMQELIISKVAGSILRQEFPMRLELSPHVKRVKVYVRSAESRGFPPGTPASSHKESRQGGLGDTGPQ